MDTTPQPAVVHAEPLASPAPACREPNRLLSTELLRGANEVLIEHQAQVYRLRLTALGKLILTK